MILPFDYRAIFQTLDLHGVDYLLIGGLNFFLLHQPVSTQDVDVLIRSSPDNVSRCESALCDMKAEWGSSDDDWELVCNKPSGWLNKQDVFCLLTKFGPLDIFLSVPGIESFDSAKHRAIKYSYSSSNASHLVSAFDLLACQLAIPEQYRRRDRVKYLEELLQKDA